MFTEDAIRDPVARAEQNLAPIDSVPDLAYEISEQSLEGVNGGFTPITASIGVTLITLSYVTNIIAAANSVQPQQDPKNPPDFTKK